MDDRVGPFIRRDLIATRIGGGQTAVSLAAGDGAAHRFPEMAAAALMGCRRFDSLAGHADRALHEHRLPDSLRQPLEQELGRALRLGLLAGWQDLAAGGDAAPAGDRGIATVALLTRNRPEAAARSLRSHLEHARTYDRSLRISVMDSSTDAGQQARTRAAVGEVARASGLQAGYASPQDRAAFAERLARASGVRPDLVRFALSDQHDCGADAGANRNALLLGHPGQLFLSTDDDVICQPHGRQPDGEPADRLRVTSEKDPTGVTLFDGPSAARTAVPARATDLFASHERLLGQSLAGLLATRSPATVSMDLLAPDLLAALLDGRARVTVTCSAILGDCGARFPTFYLWRPEVKDQLAGLPEPAYQALVESRQLFRAPGLPTVTSGAFLMSTHLAFDHRALLPPFFPVLRGQDITFARLLRMFSDAPLIGHLPEAILHEPVEPRRASLQNLWSRDRRPSLPSVLEACLRTATPGCALAPPGAGRLRLIGRHLRELGGLEEPAFDRILRSYFCEGAGARLAAWQSELDRSPVPPGPWRRDLDGVRATYLDMLAPDRDAAVSELVERFGPAEGRRLTRALVAEFGELLESWPEISAAAAGLERAGQGLFHER